MNTCESLQFGIEGEGTDEYSYYVSEFFPCDSINDVGDEAYCLLSDDEALDLQYTPTTRTKGQRKMSRSEVDDFYRGYCNSCLGDPMSIEDFARKYLRIEL